VGRMGAALDQAAALATRAVGTVYCALVFAAVALVSLPGALATGDVVAIVAWIAQTFLQLVLLSVIMVGQRLQGARTEARDEETHKTVMESHDELHQLLTEIHARTHGKELP
jgi:hypothetical protein